MRTLVISDLHLGARSGRDVLRTPAVLDMLCVALAHADRLVLLGDTVEMLEGRPRRALEIAEPILRRIGEALGPDAEVIFVPGNHDHALVYPWLEEQRAAGKTVGYSARVAARSNPDLLAIAQWLKPARTQFRYPGVDLGDGIWAHHGHYLDRHLVRSPLVGDRATVEQYERSVGVTASRITASVAASMPPAVGEAVDQVGHLVARAAVLARPAVAALPGAGILAPLSAGALGYQFRRAGLPAIAAVANALEVPHRDVIFGHVHRSGPRPADDLAEWQRGERRLWNSGCWVYEPLLLAGAQPPQPYWPGGALWVEDGSITPVGLLDSLAPELLR